MTQYIDKGDLVAEIERRIKEIDVFGTYLSPKGVLTNLLCHLNTLEVKEVDISSISENLAEAYEYLGYTHTSNLAHNKPMIAASLRRAIKKLYNAGLFQLTHDVKYRMESLGLKTQKGE